MHTIYKHTKTIFVCMKISTKGLVALLIAMLELAFLPIMLEIGGSSVGAVQLLVYTFMVGSVVSLVVAYSIDRGRNLMKIVRSGNALVITAIAGILNYGVAQVFLTLGTLGTNPSIASVIFRSWVLMLAIMVPFTLKNKVNIYQLLATVVGFLGVFVLATGGTLTQIAGGELPFIGLLLASAVAAAVSNLIIKRYSVSTVDSVAIFNVASLGFASTIAVMTGTPINFVVPAPALASILFLGIVTYTLGSMLFYYSFKTLNTILVSNLSLAIPFLTIPFAFLLLGTPIEGYYVYAYLLIVAGIVLQQKYSQGAPEYIQSKESALNTLQIFDVTSAFVNNSSEVVYNSVARGKRALAVKIDNNAFDPAEHGQLFYKYDCIVFTDKDPHPAVQKDELEFINEIVGPAPGQDLLICLGDSKKLENALTEFAAGGTVPLAQI